jgi:hypothetical protein
MNGDFFRLDTKDLPQKLFMPLKTTQNLVPRTYKVSCNFFLCLVHLSAVQRLIITNVIKSQFVHSIQIISSILLRDKTHYITL